MSSTEISLIFLLQSDPQSSSTIFRFLNKKEIARLGATCTDIRKRVYDHQSVINNSEYVQWRTQKLSKLRGLVQKGKSQQNQTMKFIETEKHYVIKMKMQEVPLKYLEALNWKHIEESSTEFSKSIKSDKFIKEHNNFFFKNSELDDVLFINRSLVDPSLNYDGGEFEKEVFEEDSKTLYEELYQGDTFSADSFDFSNMQSLLARQRQVTASIGKKQQKQQDKIDSQIGPLAYMGQLRSMRKVTVILCHGGFFSIGIFDEKGNCIFHKSDHKYVVRKKAGQRQLNCDTQSGKQVKSMGSQIRRDQEKKHQEKVHSILSDHIEQIDSTDVVFLQAPGINKLILIKENEPLMRVRHKIRSICLTAKKANYTEVERIYNTITKIYLVLQKQN